MAKTVTVGINEAVVERLEIPKNLTTAQYFELKNKYVYMIVSAKKQLKDSYEIYKDELRSVLSYRRKLNDAEDRLVETIGMLDRKSKKK